MVHVALCKAKKTSLRGSGFPDAESLFSLQCVRYTDRGREWTNMNSGEFARLAGVTQRALRHWRNLGLLSEVTAGDNGYYDYTVRDLLKVLRIKNLSALGFSLTVTMARRSAHWMHLWRSRSHRSKRSGKCWRCWQSMICQRRHRSTLCG